MKGAYNFSFPTLLHFPRELLLTGNDLREATVVIVKMVQRETLRREKDLEKRGNVKFLRKIVRLRPILIYGVIRVGSQISNDHSINTMYLFMKSFKWHSTWSNYQTSYKTLLSAKFRFIEISQSCLEKKNKAIFFLKLKPLAEALNYLKAVGVCFSLF